MGLSKAVHKEIRCLPCDMFEDSFAVNKTRANGRVIWARILKKSAHSNGFRLASMMFQHTPGRKVEVGSTVKQPGRLLCESTLQCPAPEDHLSEGTNRLITFVGEMFTSSRQRPWPSSRAVNILINPK